MDEKIFERIEEVLSSYKGTKSDLAKKLGIDERTQRNYINGTRLPSVEYLLDLGKEGLDNAYILTGQRAVPDGFVKIPKMSAMGSMGSGVPSEYNHDEIIDHITVSENWLKSMLSQHSSKQNLCIVSCVGDSMEPTLRHGDAVFVDTNVTEFQNDAIYMFEAFGEVKIKRLQRISTDDLKILSDNPHYDPIILHKNDAIRMIGRVVGRLKFDSF